MEAPRSPHPIQLNRAMKSIHLRVPSTGPLGAPFEMLALPFATGVFDRYGTYSPAFVACLGGYAVSALMLMILPISARKGPADLATSD